MSASATNIQGCNEHGGEDTLPASSLKTTKNSSRNIWNRIRMYYFVVRIAFSYSFLKTSPDASVDIGEPEIQEVLPEEDGSHPMSPSSASNSGSADCIVSISDCTPEEVARIVRERDLNSLQNFVGGEQVKFLLESYFKEEIDRSFEEQGPALIITNNTVKAKEFVSFFLKACKSRTNFFLLVSAALSFTTEMIELEPKYGWHDGVAILVAVFMLVIFQSVANYRRARQLQKRNKFQVRVLRQEQPQTITISSLAVGHTLCMKKGDVVPADGLFVKGNGLKLDDKMNPNINFDENPFLFSGSEIIDGEGEMVVTSVGDNTVLGRLQSLAKVDPDEKTLIEAQIDETNAYMENVGLSISVLVFALVLFNLVVRKLDKNSNIMPEIKGDVSAHRVIKIFERVFLKPRGKVQILTSVLTVLATSLQHGMPVVITVSLSYWKKKMASVDTNVQNLPSCGTIGIISVICFDLTTEPIDETIEAACKEVIKSTVEALKKEGVGCKVMSEDELAAVKEMAREIGISNPDLNSMAIESKDLGLATAARMNEIVVIGSCKLEDKIHVLQRLKQGGHVVAFIGGMTTNDTLALKEADLGITVNGCSTKNAKENSDIVISSMSSLSSLIPSLEMGRCAFGNVQTFIQIQLTATLSGLFVTLVTTLVLDESPITGIHLAWVNCIICVLGGLIMVKLHGHHELMNNPPARRMESLLTKTMWRNVMIRAASDAYHLLLLQFIGQAIIHINKDVVKTMVFNGFILCRVLDLFSTIISFARNEVSIVICSSHWFFMASGASMAMQVVLVELLQSLADYERLNVMQWGFCFIYAAWMCRIVHAVKFIADSASDVLLSLRSNGSQFGFLSVMFGIPFSVFLVASFSYY